MTPDPSPLLIAVMGPTASGKSTVAEAIADRLGLQLINADAFMVYKGFDIGTNKPVHKEKYELIDIIDPTQDFGVGEYVRRAAQLLERIYSTPPLTSEGEGAGGEGPSKKVPFTSPPAPAPAPAPAPGAILVGGTGLYVRALLENYTDLKPAPDPQLRRDLEHRLATQGLQSLVTELQQRAPETAQSIDLQNPVRVRRALERLQDPNPPIQFTLPPFAKHKFILDPDPGQLDQAIAQRTETLLRSGWVEEVAQLLAKGIPRTAPAFRAIGYDYVIDLIEGRLGMEEAKDRITTSTRQYAKRQRTWLRAEPNARTLPVLNLDEQGAKQTTDQICNALLSR